MAELCPHRRAEEADAQARAEGLQQPPAARLCPAPAPSPFRPVSAAHRHPVPEGSVPRTWTEAPCPRTRPTHHRTSVCARRCGLRDRSCRGGQRTCRLATRSRLILEAPSPPHSRFRRPPPHPQLTGLRASSLAPRPGRATGTTRLSLPSVTDVLFSAKGTSRKVS